MSKKDKFQILDLKTVDGKTYRFLGYKQFKAGETIGITQVEVKSVPKELTDEMLEAVLKILPKPEKVQ